MSKKKTDLAISGEPEDLDLPSLVRRIADIHNHLVERAIKAMNASLTLRNWLIGFSIQNYELEGNDHATCGDRIFSKYILVKYRLTGLWVDALVQQQAAVSPANLQ